MRNNTATMMMAGLVLAFSTATLPLTATAETIETNSAEKPELVESGTVDIEAESMRLILGGAKGKGMLHYNGNDYFFTLKGASVGGVGYTKVVSSGTVYNLKSLEDFPGTYSGMGVGAVVVKGAGASSWENNKGVVISMQAKDASGLALNLGINAVEVELVK